MHTETPRDSSSCGPAEEKHEYAETKKRLTRTCRGEFHGENIWSQMAKKVHENSWSQATEKLAHTRARAAPLLHAASHSILSSSLQSAASPGSSSGRGGNLPLPSICQPTHKEGLCTEETRTTNRGLSRYFNFFIKILARGCDIPHQRIAQSCNNVL